jgi:hypothetical protein
MNKMTIIQNRQPVCPVCPVCAIPKIAEARRALSLLISLALFCAAAFAQDDAAQDLPRIAVYVTGDVPDNEKSALGTRMLASLVNSGRYRGIERSSGFLAEIEREQTKQRSGDIDDGQISELGKQFGVKFVCIAAITPAFGSFQVSARIVNVETAEVEFIGEASSLLRTMDDLAEVSDKVVQHMFGGQARPKQRETSGTSGTGAEANMGAPWMTSPGWFTYMKGSRIISPNGFAARTSWMGRVSGLISKKDAKGRTLLTDMRGKTVWILDNDAQGRTLLMNSRGEVVLISGNDEQGRTLVMDARGEIVRISESDEQGRALLMNKRGKVLRISEDDAQGRTLLRDARENITMISENNMQGRVKIVRDWYFALKYQIPISNMSADWGSVHAEFAYLWGDIFFGPETGYSGEGISMYLNISSMYDLNHDLQLVYGGTYGYIVKDETYWVEPTYIGQRGYYQGRTTIGAGVGPFIGLRWRFVELSYRGLMVWEMHGYSDSGFGYDNQLSLGLYLATSKRKR